VPRNELRVEQGEAAILKPGDEINEGDLARIARSREHALAEERAAEMYAIEAAGELAVLPDLDRVTMAQREQLAIKAPDARVDPGRAPT